MDPGQIDKQQRGDGGDTHSSDSEAVDSKPPGNAASTEPTFQVNAAKVKLSQSPGNSNLNSEIKNADVTQLPSPQPSKDPALAVNGDEDSENSKSGNGYTAVPSENAPRPDILYCLTLLERGKSERRFYKDVAWKGTSRL
jgi:hypothetical protein